MKENKLIWLTTVSESFSEPPSRKNSKPAIMNRGINQRPLNEFGSNITSRLPGTVIILTSAS